ncbi:glycine--tRNA ligase subunit alpha [Candidatus Hepatobacter penaei]|uniref:glycine--tRNA ligase subunit alpha n=1 Tax=Candidatus Hepatobacter penaei TaxID=1274402 RepID=UPI0004F2558B|nr:glycine--tRNA ligase subunit alpha [Candidatus Hepatobacter penaei]
MNACPHTNDLPFITFQGAIATLNAFWANQGCALLPSYDIEMGAGTFHPETVFRCLGATPFYGAFVQPSRRPTDGRFGLHPNRVYRHHQFQVLLKPSPANVQDLMLQSFEALGLDMAMHDIRFVEDNWKSPTLGAAGLGWEVWCDGMEILQFTYFQQMGGIPLKPITAELVYGLERLMMFLQHKDCVYDLLWQRMPDGTSLTYGDVYQEAEAMLSSYNFHEANVCDLTTRFSMAVKESKHLSSREMPLPAYERCVHASHIFNLLDARGALSDKERVSYIQEVRHCAEQSIHAWQNRASAPLS